MLNNLFLHYAFDVWMQRDHSDKPWCRYADDGLIHCKTEEQAQQLLADLRLRFKECGLALHAEQTRIVYCKDETEKIRTRKRILIFWATRFEKDA